ncbi:MAG TPA: hypothetical protein PKX92_09820 [Edaphocola sp.]|nr:hypothetical protein [Edaphocola sp.]
MRSVLTIFSVLLSFLLWTSCSKSPKKTDWSLKYNTKFTEPFGFSLFKHTLPLIYPKANVQEVGINSSIFENISKVEPSVYIILAEYTEFGSVELQELNNWLLYGNDVVIISNNFGKKLGDYFGYDSTVLLSNYYHDIVDVTMNDSAKTKVKNINIQVNNFSDTGIKSNYNFSPYKYEPFGNHFSINTKDKFYKSLSSQSKIISQENKERINAIAFQVGKGNLIVVNSPIALSNFYLLQNNNINYLSDILSYTNKDIDKVYFTVGKTRESYASNWGIIWKHKGTRTALLITLFALLTYTLIHLKRKQNIIPMIEPLSNDSKSFIVTIANLYYSKRNNKNMAQKMIQHFMENVRNNYKLNTNNLDKEFKQKLALRTGNSEADTNALITQLKAIQDDTVIVDDKYLFNLYSLIQKFIKK